MGKRGSEVSREAADLIRMDDNFSTIADTVRNARRIYDNIRKAVGYVITIHIPIDLSALPAPFPGIAPAAPFLLPLHVVPLEVIIDPTCSIVLERQPAEGHVMERRPRDQKLLTAGRLVRSVFQRLAIFAASFISCFVVLECCSGNVPVSRSMGRPSPCRRIFSWVNSSDRDPVYISTRRLVKDKVMWAAHLGTLVLLGLVLYTPVSAVLKLTAMPMLRGALCLAAMSVLWYEPMKLINRARRGKSSFLVERVKTDNDTCSQPDGVYFTLEACPLCCVPS